MKERTFSLQPLAPAVPEPEVRITGSIARRGHGLALHYALRGRLAGLALPGPAENPTRRHRLWEDTCFEIFLAVKNSPHYWEFNLSPAGHWNVYGFTAYRQGMAEETALASLPFRVRRQPDSLLLALEVDLARIVRPDQALEAALAAVIKLKTGEATYWALTHPGPRADFHRRDGFLIEL
jgi:hypothetical protein